MNRSPRARSSLSSVLICILLTLFSFNQPVRAADVVSRKGEKSAISGEITEISPTGLVIKLGSRKKPIEIPANEITDIRWDKEPAAFRLFRNDERGGRLQKALDGYQKIIKDTSISKRAATDVRFLIARCKSKIALNDPSTRNEAIQKLDAFRKKHANSVRYFECLHLLGQLHIANEDHLSARKIYALLRHAPWPDYQSDVKLAEARSLLIEGKIDDALAEFEKIIRASSNKKDDKQILWDATLGKAACLARQKKFDKATALLEDLLQQTSPDDALVEARIYIQLGALMKESGRPKDAILAYLHIDLIYSSQTAMHAEALFRLTPLWNEIGHPDRADDSSNRLKKMYPSSRWARELVSRPSK